MNIPAAEEEKAVAVENSEIAPQPEVEVVDNEGENVDLVQTAAPIE